VPAFPNYAIYPEWSVAAFAQQQTVHVLPMVTPSVYTLELFVLENVAQLPSLPADQVILFDVNVLFNKP